MKSKNWFLKRARKMFSDPSFYAFIFLCFYGLVIYPGCKFDTSGIGGGVGYSITPPPDGCVNQYYYYDLNSYYGIYGFNPFPQYQLTSGSLPPGLDLDVNNGILSGFPTATGEFTFEIDVVDAASVVLASGSFTININDFSIVTSFLPPICAGTTYSAIIDICGGIPPFTWETIDWHPSVLPLNFTVPGPANSRQNTLAGTPVTPGDYTFEIRVTDIRGAAFRIKKKFTLEVTDEITILTPRHLPSGIVGVPYSHTLEACGGTTPYTWDKVDTTSTPWPVFLLLDPSSGTLSGIPTAAGAYFLKVKLSEGGGSSTEKYFSLTVAASPLVVANMNLNFVECTPSANINLSGMLSGGLGVPYWQLAARETLPPL
ncbi:MAG: putative Ig domain-containing protein, partial [Candidatus Aminicenantes bacterium]|nr:putative Ig domain-containing protein [Candidatus Aminicenantes bacterium]